MKKSIFKSQMHLYGSIAVLACFLVGCSTSSREVDIQDFGAKGDGETINTQFIQSAIDEVERNGGGTVHIREGDFVTGTILLKDNVTIHIHSGATLLGSLRQEDYLDEIATLTDGIGQKFGYALIYGKGVKNISLVGKGTIDGRGSREFFSGSRKEKRPSILRIEDSENVKIQGLTLTNSAFWVQHYRNSRKILVDGITVVSHSNGNNDGIDIDGSEQVKIINSSFDTGDDSIVLKSLSDRVVKDVLIKGNKITGEKSAVKTGTESVGGFEDVIIEDLIIEETRGINLYSVDGANLKNFTVRNIQMNNSYGVLMMRLGSRMNSFDGNKNPKRTPGIFKNVNVSGIKATNVQANNDFISGIPGYYIEDIMLKEIEIEFSENANIQFAEGEIPEKEGSYPKERMFGDLPSLGFMIRHAKNVQLDEISYRIPDPKGLQALVSCMNVDGITTSGVTLNNVMVESMNFCSED